MLKQLRVKVARFTGAAGGGVVVVFALALVPFLGVVGAAIDYSRLSSDRALLQNVADAAALAAALESQQWDGDPSRVATERARSASFPSGLEVRPADYRLVGGAHVVTVAASRANAFGNFTTAMSEISVRAEAVASIRGRPAQVAIVMDTTASMSFGTRWSSTTDTITAFLEQMRRRDSSRFRVAFVPFSDRVKIDGLPGFGTWMDRHRPGNWNGCVEPIETRSGAFHFAVDARFPGDGDLLFQVSHQSTIAQGKGAIGRLAHHGTPFCPNVAAVAPTTDLSAIERAVRAAQPGGTGRFDEGLVWGWRMLTAEWMNAMSVTPPRGEEDPERIVLVLTDGNATIYEIEVGGAAGGNYGWNNGSPLGFAHLVHLCERMRADGVRIIMLRLPGNRHFEPYARACAASEDDYFFVDGPAALETALRQVAMTSVDVRLTR